VPQTAKSRQMSVGYPSDGERFRESIGVELRIRPRAGDRTDVDEQIHSHLLEQSQKLTPAFVSFWSLLSLSLVEAVLTSPCGDKAFVKRFGNLSDREFAQIFSQGIEAANCTLEEKAQGVRRSFLIRAHDEGKDRGKRATKNHSQLTSCPPLRSSTWSSSQEPV
jgi:hypothetical protein